MNLEEIKKDRDLVNCIDCEMTPEEAVTLYLEWGNNWAHGNYVIRSKDDVSHYFIINNWGKKPQVLLIKRNSEEAKELAVLDLPSEIIDYIKNTIGDHKGVYSIEGKVKTWLKQELDVST